ncbi:3663_t:CDS:2, partial [Scutellospora calospora]
STFASNIDALTKVLYYQQCRENAMIEFDLEKFEYIIGNANSQLEGFFSSMMNAIIPKKRSAYSINEAKSVIWEAVDIIASLDYSACAKTVEEFYKKIQNEYAIKIEQHFINH